jgi:hypothetical protein
MRTPLGQLIRRARGSSRNVRHEQPIGHALLKVPEITAVSVLGIEIADASPSAVLNSTT